VPSRSYRALKLSALIAGIIGVFIAATFGASRLSHPTRPSDAGIESGPRRVLMAGGLEAVRAANPLYFEPSPDRTRSGFIYRGTRSVVEVGPAAAVIAMESKAERGPSAEGYGGGIATAAIKLVGANEHAAGMGAGPVKAWSRYYLGNDRAAWRENVPNYGRVEYSEVYPGVDLAYHGEQGRLEFDFIAKPGADPDRIRMAFDGVRSARLNDAGDLILSTSGGDLRLDRPVAYQDIGGHRTAIAAAFRVGEAGEPVRFALGPYDKSRPLVIDPIISYSDYLGGRGDDTAVAIALDKAGNRYVTGMSSTGSGWQFPILISGFRPGMGTAAYVAKIDPDGARVWITFLGGTVSDASGNATNAGAAIATATDSAANVNIYVAGNTDATDFPVSGGPLQPTNAGGTDAFVARLDSNGALGYATYLGGSKLDLANAVAIGPDLSIYLGGSTRSTDFPTTLSVMQPNKGGVSNTNGFVTKIDKDGQLVFSSYLGGTRNDKVFALAVDEASSLYVAGSAESTDLPTTPHAFQRIFGCPPPCSTNTAGQGVQDGFVAKLKTDGTAPVYLSYFGGSAFDGINAMALDTDPNDPSVHDVYITGFTASTDFPSCPANSFSCIRGPFDAFVAKLKLMSDSTSTLVYSTLVGGDRDDEGLAIAVDTQGRVAVAGQTDSTDFPLVDPLQLQYLGTGTGTGNCAGKACNGFITRLTADGKNQLFSTYFGGTSDDRVTGAAVDESGTIHVAGISSSADLPLVTPAPVKGNAGGRDGFIASVRTDPLSPLPNLAISTTTDPTPTPQSQPLTFTVAVANTGVAPATGVMVAADVTVTITNGRVFKASQVHSPDTACTAMTAGVLCPVAGPIPPGGSSRLEIQATSPEIGNASITATLVRADQSGIDPTHKSATTEKLVVDNSGSGGSLSWELLALAMAPFSRRRRSCRT
jgi:hypothetical protein